MANIELENYDHITVKKIVDEVHAEAYLAMKYAEHSFVNASVTPLEAPNSVLFRYDEQAGPWLKDFIEELNELDMFEVSVNSHVQSVEPNLGYLKWGPSNNVYTGTLTGGAAYGIAAPTSKPEFSTSTKERTLTFYPDNIPKIGLWFLKFVLGIKIENF